MPCRWGYPTARERAGPPRATLTDQFPRQETSAGYVTLSDTDADVLVFSGRPQRIEAVVELFDAILSLQDETLEGGQEITLRAGQRYEWQTAGRRVRGRNATAGSNARVQVIARWA